MKSQTDISNEEAEKIFGVNPTTEVAIFNPAGIGLETIDPRQLPPPIVKLIQPTTKDATDMAGKEVPPGSFLNTASKEVYEKLTGTILAIGSSRVRWGKELSDPSLCRSTDAVTGVGDPGGNCATCLHAFFNADNTPPDCQAAWNFLMIPEGSDTPVIFRASGVSFKPGKRFVSSIFYTKQRTPLAFLVSVSSHKEENEKGKYYVLDFSILQPNTPERVRELADLAQTFKRAIVTTAVDEEGVING